jgi:translation elongation factor EF-Tu-like GTPase
MSLERADYAGRVATEFDADLRLLPASEGGRETALRSGYRSIARFGGINSEPWGVEITLDLRAEVAPGESALVHVTAWADPPLPTGGTEILLYEGARLVGTLVVQE